jgi:soluble lytic murein transglycosylase-like protein
MKTPTIILFVCFATGAFAQEQSAIGKQKLSIRRQVRAPGNGDGFFTTSFLNSWATTPSPAAPPSLSEPTADCDAVPDTTLMQMILDVSQREGVNPKLVRAVVKRESAGKPCAVSAKGAQGLMQLMPATQGDLGLRDPFDPAANLAAGIKYLKQMLDRYDGNTALALAAYNAGPQRVSLGGKIPDIPETQSYVTGILAALNDQDLP